MYYLDQDLRNHCFYVIPWNRSADSPFMVEIKTRYQAEGLLKKLNAGLIKGPLEAPQLYDLVRESEFKGKFLKVYALKTPKDDA